MKSFPSHEPAQASSMAVNVHLRFSCLAKNQITSTRTAQTSAGLFTLNQNLVDCFFGHDAPFQKIIKIRSKLLE